MAVKSKEIVQATQTYTYLNLVAFKDLFLWDVKRIAKNKIQSSFPIVKLGDYIKEQAKKYKLSENPQEEFKILGVNNKTGLFDAYIEKGSNINQPYKKMEYGWLAYNPYRINVGSIGWKHNAISFDFISPAYVVFSCEKELLPEYLFLLFKSNYFNRIIRESTTGSVRQNLSFDNLSSLQIPLPSLKEQHAIVMSYNKTMALAKQQEEDAEKDKAKSTTTFYESVGIKINDKNERRNSTQITFIKYSSISRWALSHILKQEQFSFDNKGYRKLSIKNVLKSFDGGKTPLTTRADFWNGDINWVSPKDFFGLEINTSEDKITSKAIKEAGMKIFPEGTILGVFRSGILRHSFPVAITTLPVTINQDLKAMIPDNSLVTNEYLLYYLHFMQKYILEKSSKVGVTVESINTDEFLNIEIIVPPIIKQQEIINKVAKNLSLVNTTYAHSKELTIKAHQDFQNAIFQS